MAVADPEYSEPEDWTGQLFRAMRADGAWVDITFGHVVDGALTKWICLPHEEMDGAAAFASILRGQGLDPGPLPSMANERWKKHSDITQAPYLRTPAAQWKMFDGEGPNPASVSPPARAWALLPAADTEGLLQRAREKGVTLNTLLLWSLSRAVAPFLNLQSGPILWEVPINLRGAVRLPNEAANHVSMVAVHTPLDLSVNALHDAFLAMLDSGLHWVIWNQNASAGRRGPEALRGRAKVIGRFSGFRVGVFSNLGGWRGLEPCPRDEGWVFAPPPLASTPLAAGCLTTHRRLGLLILAHPRLTTDPALTGVWMDAWRRELFSA